MLGERLTTRRRCATSVCSCSGTQAPGQRQWRVGSSSRSAHIFPVTPHGRDSLISGRAAAPGASGPSSHCCARVRGREGQPHHPSRHLIASSSPRDCCCLLLVSPAPSLWRDASSVLCVPDTHGRSRRDPLTAGQGVSFRSLSISARPLHHFLLSANLLRFIRSLAAYYIRINSVRVLWLFLHQFLHSDWD